MKTLIDGLIREIRSRSAAAHISFVVLTLQAFLTTVYRIGLNQSFTQVVAELPFGTYVTDGRLFATLGLWLAGVAAYILLPRLTVWILALHLVWFSFLDVIVYQSIGGPDVWTNAAMVYGYFEQLASWQGNLFTLSLLVVVISAVWSLTKSYRARVSNWIDKRGAEIAKNSGDYEHTSTLALIALVVAFIFPIGGLILASIAKRDIALGRQKMGGLDLIVAANVVSIAILVLQTLVVLVWLGNLVELWQLLSQF